MSLPAYPMHSGPFTKADRDALPETGRVVELIDGALIVSPSPGANHNHYVTHLAQLLHAARPAGITIFDHSYDLALRDGSVLVPDILVARTSELGDKEMTEIPLLVVEVLSPSSRLSDPTVKRAKYAQHGVPAYWILDPLVPRLTLLSLAGDRYETAAVLTGTDGEATVDVPFPVTLHLRIPD